MRGGNECSYSSFGYNSGYIQHPRAFLAGQGPKREDKDGQAILLGVSLAGVRAVTWPQRKNEGDAAQYSLLVYHSRISSCVPQTLEPRAHLILVGGRSYELTGI